jgi:hypothetical protein
MSHQMLLQKSHLYHKRKMHPITECINLANQLQNWHKQNHFPLRLPTLPSSLLVTKLTTVPTAAINTVCARSPKENEAQIEHSVPPIAPNRISFHFIGYLLFFLLHNRLIRRRLLRFLFVRIIQHRLYYTKPQRDIFDDMQCLSWQFNRC